MRYWSVDLYLDESFCLHAVLTVAHAVHLMEVAVKTDEVVADCWEAEE